MHIEYLYYFRDFSKSLSISKTAAEYYMTPQGLSRALHQLEKDFGITLMAYNNNAVTLTPAGKELAERVEPDLVLATDPDADRVVRRRTWGAH